MGFKKFTDWFWCAMLFLCTTALGFCADTNEYLLLTENGANNPAYSEYKNAPILKTGGSYYAMPAFAPEFAAKFDEKGTVTSPTSFSSGILCNGDTSIDGRRKPCPYVYWQDKTFASLFFDLKKQYFISKVRVKILLRPNIHGMSKIGVYTGEEILEAGSQPLKEITTPVNGWNVFVVDKPSDKIKLDFTAAPGCPFMTIQEIEIWGREYDSPVSSDSKKEVPSKADAVGKRDYLAFDFGPVNSPIWEDFTPVSEKTIYTKDRGYGWVPLKDEKPLQESGNVPGLFSRDRLKYAKVYDNFFVDGCWARNFYNIQFNQEFIVDVKNGKYLVYLGAGDIVFAKPGEAGMTVDAQGKRVINKIVHDCDLCARAQFPVEVNDGQLRLRFGNDSDEEFERDWGVSGLLILPINNQNEQEAAKQTVSAFEKKINSARDVAFADTCKEVKYEEPTKLFPLTKTDTDRGYILFVRDWMNSVYANTVPQKSEADKNELSIWCSPGEYEPAAFGIYPLANLEAQITVSDLVSRTKNKIGKENISIRVTGYLPERIKDVKKTAGDYTYYLPESSWGTSYMMKFPKILWPYKDKISIDETKQIWLTVHVPKTAKPGVYEGTVAFKPSGKPEQALKLSVNVYPIDLQKSDRIAGVYWVQGNDVSPEYRKKEFQDMAEHGIRSLVPERLLPEFKTENKKLTIDFTQMDKLVQEMKDAGLTKYMPFITARIAKELEYLSTDRTGAIDMSFDDAYAYAISEIYKHAQENDWPEVLFYPVDEIGAGVTVMNTLKRLATQIRKTPGAKIFCTANNYAAGVKCEDYIDYWCANIQMPRAQEQYVLDKGKVLMRYGNSYNYNPRTSRTASGFGFWRIPAAAMYYYHYQYVIGDPFNSVSGYARDFMCSYPSPEGPINSIDFEAIREGIDDLNYIYTLQTLMDKARKSGKGDLTKDGEAILDEITNCDPAYYQYDFAGVPNERYHEWRQRMAQEIVKLQAAL